MPISLKEAIPVLEAFKQHARDEADGSWCKRYNNTLLECRVIQGKMHYFWGVNEVDSHVALNVIMTFTESSR